MILKPHGKLEISHCIEGKKKHSPRVIYNFLDGDNLVKQVKESILQPLGYIFFFVYDNRHCTSRRSCLKQTCFVMLFF